ncbi:hypothetical protein SVAN01_00321 [Stagonosporopsis vannaccii]|nr:hypothetical protein SVAN01_00321 [Stagonosporopsis vannaccii]
MALHLLQLTIPLLTLLSTSHAQTPSIIPADLSTGFNKKEVQVSFSNKATDGFASGTSFPRDAVANEPTFALGDSNGISPSTRYTLIMVDTTCPSARKLHYVRSNFKFSFAGGTNMETESAPLVEYKAPGALGEQGDQRQYVFLMYTNPQRREIAEMQTPVEGEVFDVKKFQGDNGLNDPVAGVGMVVQLGGTADCGGEGANQLPEGLPTAAPGTSQSAASPSRGTGASQTLVSSGGAPAPSSTPSGGDGQQGTPPTTAAPAVSSTPLDTDETAPTPANPINSFTSVRATITGSPTTSSAPLEQTANAASGTMVRNGAFMAQLLLVAGVLGW